MSGGQQMGSNMMSGKGLKSDGMDDMQSEA